jgi:hypothetical protein
MENIVEQTPAVEKEVRPSLFDAAKIKHIVSDGVYIKTYFVPAGVKLYTKQFPEEHISILSLGSVLVDNGSQKTRYIAPAHVVIPANRRVEVVTLENSVWYCVHPTDVTDLETLKELY